MIVTRGLNVTLGSAAVLRDVSVRSPQRGVLGVVGPNGSGKTTLLRAMYGALAPDSGTVEVDGQELNSLTRRERARQIAVVSQHSEDLEYMSVADVVMLGRIPFQGRSSAQADEAAVAQALTRVGMLERAQRDFTELSGGERQRVHIARALAQETGNLLLDEPTNHLDVFYQHEVLGLLSALDASVTVVLHDLNLAAQYCSEIIIVDGGKVVAAGTPRDVFTPEILEPIYGVRITRIEVEGTPHLIMGR